MYSEAFRGHIPEENLLFFSSGHQLSIASQLWVGSLCVPLQFAGILVWLTLCRSSACSHSCCEFMFSVALSCPADIISGQTPTASGPYGISASSFSLIPAHWRERVWMIKMFHLEMSTPHSFILCMLTSINHHLLIEKLLWWGSRDSLIYGHKDKNLRVSLLLCHCNRIAVLASLLGPLI